MGQIVLFYNNFSPIVEQPEQRITARCIAMFYKYCCYAKRGGIITNLTPQHHWGYIIDVSKYHKAGILSMDYDYITFYVQKHIAPLAKCYNPPLVRDKPLGVPAIVNLIY